MINERLMNKWRKSVGGLTKATILISQNLECSLSKAEKVATCRYPHLSSQEKEALSCLTKIKLEDLFSVKRKTAS